MAEEKTVYVPLEQLRVGLYVYLDLGWMSHPFPSSSFKISSAKQLETIRTLGLSRVRVCPDKSDPEGSDDAHDSGSAAAATAAADVAAGLQTTPAERRRRLLIAQKLRFAACEENFKNASSSCIKVFGQVVAQPTAAAAAARELVTGLVTQLMARGHEAAIHLLSDGSGERAALHPVNVTVLSLLLGRALELDVDAMHDLGMAAMLHDVGKEQLPQRVRWPDTGLAGAEEAAYRNHVNLSVDMGRRMGLNGQVLFAMSQHHEMVDGSGFPVGVKGDSMSQIARALALVNRYDNLCNPANINAALTPHEVLAHLFAQAKNRFDTHCLNAFIRLMGVYPPGSVVQLADDRYGLVMTVNGARPLRPQVVLYDPQVPKDEALILDLEAHPKLGIRRSLKPMHLPREVLEYLSPRKRVTYFFDQAATPPTEETPP